VGDLAGAGKSHPAIHEQEMAYRASAAASLDPITRDPEQYRSYIDSLPDDDSDEK